MARSIPIVRARTLYYQLNAQEYQLSIDSEAWYNWLETATTFNFEGLFTARREQAGNKRGGWYWKAYVKRKGKVHCIYLGKSDTLTFERLQAAAVQLPAKEKELAATLDDGVSSVHRYMHIAGPLSREAALVQANGLIGREQELAALCTLLKQPRIRLVTMTGPAGVGKSSLALQAITSLAQHFRDGICAVSLAALNDPALVVSTLAQELGVIKEGGASLLADVQFYLREKQLLLLLDNFEQIINAAAVLTELLVACTQLTILVTSREILRIQHEQIFIVPPLALPDLKGCVDPEQLLRSASVDLFVQRAVARRTDFQVTPEDVYTLAKLCIHLDGLPLAIELAAACVRVFPPAHLLARLEQRFQLLTHGARDVPERQQTLRATLDWSYRLLNEEEQGIFRLLSIFVRGCTFSLLEAMCAQLNDVMYHNLLENIAALIDKSLLQQVEQNGDESRLLMLETIHAYGVECLLSSGEMEKVGHAHACCYLALAEQAAPELRKAQQAYWFGRLLQEQDNMRAALRWFLEHDDSASALRICNALWLFWVIRCDPRESFQWVEKALALSEDRDIKTAIRAEGTFAAGVLAHYGGEGQRSSDHLHESLQLYEEIGDTRGIAQALTALGQILAKDNPTEARLLYRRSLALSQAQRNVYGAMDAYRRIANDAVLSEDNARADMMFTEGLVLAQRQGDCRSIALCLDGLAHVAMREGHYPHAHKLLMESLALYKEIGDRTHEVLALLALRIIAYHQELEMQGERVPEKHEAANRKPVISLEEFLSLAHEVTDEQKVASRLFALGSIEYTQGTLVNATLLMEESLSLYTRQRNRAMMAASLNTLAHVRAHRGKYAEARVVMERSIALTRETGDRQLLASQLMHLGLLALNERNEDAAHRHMKEGLSVARELNQPRSTASVVGVMGLFHLYQKNIATAQSMFEESLLLARKVEDRYTIAYRLADLGVLMVQIGAIIEARALFEESLQMSMQLKNRWFIASCMERLGEVLVLQEQPVWATHLWGTATALRETIDGPIPAIERAAYEDAQTIAQKQLGNKQFVASWQAGYMLTPQQCMAIVQLQEMPARKELPIQQKGDGMRSSLLNVTTLENALDRYSEHVTDEKLTQREYEILQSIVLGASNREIAQDFTLSEGTVKKHISNIYGKLGVQSRPQAVTKSLALAYFAK